MPLSSDTLSPAEARRIALAAQGFADPRPASGARLDARHARRVFDALALVQIDSVNVFSRSHYLPPFARLGAYPRDVLDRVAWGRTPGDRGRALFEYWGHEASLIPLDHHPLYRWRMARAARGEGIYQGLARFARERAAFVDEVEREIRDRGPLGAGELEKGERGEGGWWGWSEAKKALEYLFWAGRVTTATRRGFERVYDLTERVIPSDVLARPTPAEPDAVRDLLRLSAAATGVATAADLRDYVRLDPEDAHPRIAELVEAGELRPVRVGGSDRPAYLWRDARLPRRVTARALLSPFDNLIWARERTERLFGFRYRLEIYTPAEKRVHGYYVLPLLLDDRLVARACLKADRAGGRLLVRTAHLEPGTDAGEAAEAMMAELRHAAAWLGLAEVAVADRGDLAPLLLPLADGRVAGAEAG
jgi:uncharacterized protein YcaQ